MRVFDTYPELQRALDLPADTLGAYRFDKRFGPAGFRCTQCDARVLFQYSGGTGYAVGKDNCAMICYPCSDANEKRAMLDRSRPFVAYLNHHGKHVTTWSGGILGTVTHESISSGFHRSRITCVRVKDVHGAYWHGRGSGRGMCITLRPMKG